MVRNKRKQPRQGPRRNGMGGRSILPIVQSQPSYRQVLRFRATGAITSTIFVRCLHNLFHCAQTNVVSNGIMGAIKILSVKVMGIADGGAGTEFNTVTLTFAGGIYGRNQEFTAAGSTAMPGSIIKRPPRNSAANFWHSVPITGGILGAGEPLFSISSLGAGVLVDVSFAYTLCDGSTLFGNTLTVVAATAGTVYTNSLDNSTSTGAVGPNALQPVGRFFLLGFG